MKTKIDNVVAEVRYVGYDVTKSVTRFEVQGCKRPPYVIARYLSHCLAALVDADEHRKTEAGS